MNAGAPNRKLSNIEMASEMYKMAFTMKQARFAELFPDLTAAELKRKTAEYFRDCAFADAPERLKQILEENGQK